MNINLSEFRSCIARIEAEFNEINLDKIKQYSGFKYCDVNLKNETIFLSLYVENPHDDFWIDKFANECGYRVFWDGDVFFMKSKKSSFFLQLYWGNHAHNND